MTEPAPSAIDAYSRTALGRFEQSALTRPGAGWVLAALLAAALLVPSVQFIVKIQKPNTAGWRKENTRRSALGRWLSDARALSEGADPYGPGHWFPNPPIVLLALVPLSKLPVSVAATIWAVAKIAAAVAAGWLAIESMRRAGIFVPLGVVLAAAICSIKPLIDDLQHGNLNIFVFLELAAVWYCFTRGRDAAAGLLLGLAITTKVTPALLLVYFLYKRCWSAACWTVIGLLVFGLALPSLFLGFSRTTHLFQAWFHMLVAPSLLHGYVTDDIINQSLPGLLTRWLAAAGAAMQKLSIESAVQFGTEDMSRPTAFAARAVIRVAMLAIVTALAWLCRTPIDRRRDPRLWLECGLVLLAMLLLSERTWKHHLVTLFLVFLPVWQILACRAWSDRFTAILVAGIVLQVLLLTGFAGLDSAFGEAAEDRLQEIGAVGIGLLLCFIQTGLLLRRTPPPIDGSRAFPVAVADQ